MEKVLYNTASSTWSSVTVWRGETVSVVGVRFKREGACVYLWLIHTALWHKSAQYCKAIVLQLKINFKKIFKKKKK